MIETLRAQWIESSTYRWYAALAVRERKLVLAALTVVGAALFILMVAQPAYEYRQIGSQLWQTERADLEWMRANRIHAAGALGDDGHESARLSTINNVSRALGIPLGSVRPEPAGGFSIRIEDLPFNDLLLWIETLRAQHRIEVTRAQIDMHEPGKINAQITLL